MQQRGLIACIDPPNTVETVVICKLDEMLEHRIVVELWQHLHFLDADRGCVADNRK